MDIYLEKSKKLLRVVFSNAELAGKSSEGALFRRRHGSHGGVTFTFEKSRKGLFLYVGFDRCKDPGVLSQIANGQSVEELQLLWELAHMPCAKIYVSNVRLPDGRDAELIDNVGFELRKVGDGAWETGGKEPEVKRLLRQMKLNRLKDGVPGIFSERVSGPVVIGQAESTGIELLFGDTLTESEPGTQSSGKFQTDSDSPSKRGIEPEKQQMELKTELKKPTAKDINDAIQLLLWRCRDAEIHKDTPNGKRGFYGLDDWISTADDVMIRELGLWCEDIQELNVGTRDS